MTSDPWTDPDPQPGDFDANLAKLDPRYIERRDGDPGAKLIVLPPVSAAGTDFAGSCRKSSARHSSFDGAMAYPNDVIREMTRLQEISRLQPGVVEAMRQLQEATRLEPGVVDAMRQLQEATKLQPGVVEAMQSAARLQPGVMRALGHIRIHTGMAQALREATSLRPSVLQALKEATSLQPNMIKALDTIRFQPGVVKALQDATRVPAQEWSELLSAEHVPLANWGTLLRTLRQSATSAGTAANTGDWDLAAEAAIAAIDETDDASLDDGKLSWLLRRSVAEQLVLLVAFLEVLYALGMFMTDLAGANEELPPEFRSGVQVLFATVAILLMIIDLRNQPNDD